MTSFIARTPLDLLAVVPYAIGFHPDDSVVVLTFGDAATGRESFHARVDLPVVAQEQERVVALLEDVLTRRGCAQVAVLFYTEDAGAAYAFGELLVPRLLAAGLEVIDTVRVAGDRYHRAADPEDIGTPYDLSEHPFTAALVVEGRVAHDSRAALADTLVGGDEEDREAIAVASDRFADRLLGAREPGGPAAGLPRLLREQALWLRDRLAAPLTPGILGASAPTPQDAGRLLVLVALDALRDVAVAAVTRDNAREHLEFWRGLTRRAPRDLLAGPASLCAFAAWLHGEGALAWCAVERCLEVEPDDGLAHHVAVLLETATPPSAWAPISPASLHVLRGPDLSEGARSL